MPSEGTMREVVQRLRAVHSDAVLELLEFDSAIEHSLQHLATLSETSLDIFVSSHSIVRAIGGDSGRQLRAVQEHAGKIIYVTNHLIAAFSALQRSLNEWNLGSLGDPS